MGHSCSIQPLACRDSEILCHPSCQLRIRASAERSTVFINAHEFNNSYSEGEMYFSCFEINTDSCFPEHLSLTNAKVIRDNGHRWKKGEVEREGETSHCGA